MVQNRIQCGIHRFSVETTCPISVLDFSQLRGSLWQTGLAGKPTKTFYSFGVKKEIIPPPPPVKKLTTLAVKCRFCSTKFSLDDCSLINIKLPCTPFTTATIFAGFALRASRTRTKKALCSNKVANNTLYWNKEPSDAGANRLRITYLFSELPAEPSCWQASTTRAAMPSSALAPHTRGSYAFLLPTSPSTLSTPS